MSLTFGSDEAAAVLKQDKILAGNEARIEELYKEIVITNEAIQETKEERDELEIQLRNLRLMRNKLITELRTLGVDTQ